MSNTREQDRFDNQQAEHNERVFSQEDLWYFRTREGKVIGPFRYRSEAETNLDRFMNQLKDQLGNNPGANR